MMEAMTADLITATTPDHARVPLGDILETRERELDLLTQRLAGLPVAHRVVSFGSAI
jgi:hypothetical protein